MGQQFIFTYLLLPPKYNTSRMLTQFPRFIDKHMANEEYIGKQASKYTSLGLQKLTDIHLYSHTDYEAEPNGDIKRVYIFSRHCIFYLTHCMHQLHEPFHCTFSFAGKGNRNKKSHRRKKRELISQFLSESVLLSWVAIFHCFGLLYLTLPGLNKISGQQISPDILMKWQILVPCSYHSLRSGDFIRTLSRTIHVIISTC